MSKLTLTDLTNITGQETSAILTINNNSQLIEEALENTLSLDGTTPNSMLSDLDMNENDILNVSNFECDTFILDGVSVASSSLAAKGDKGDTGATGAQGPAGSTSPVATTSATGTVTLGTLAQSLVGSPTGAYAPTLDVIKAIIDMVCPVGTVDYYMGSTAPVYWLEVNGGSIGNGTSGGTARANADTVNLYTLLWSNTNLTIQTSTGTPSSRGADVATDFAASKRLVLPDAQGYFLRGWSNGSSVDSGRTNLSSQAHQFETHVHTGTTSSSGTHSHGVPFGVSSFTTHGPQVAGGTPSDGTNAATTANGAHTHFVTTSAITSGTAGTETRPSNLSMMIIVRY